MTPKRFDEIRLQCEAGETPHARIVEECLEEIARLAALVYVPGSFRCPKCNFGLVQSVVHLKSGTIGAGRHCDEPCPNDGTTLEPVTWEHDAREMAGLMPELAKLRRLRDSLKILEEGIADIRAQEV